MRAPALRLRAFAACALATGAAVALDASSAGAESPAHAGVDTPLERVAPAPRVAAWARDLAPVEVVNGNTHERALLRFYRDDGEVDDDARVAFERVATSGGASHAFNVRVEQLVILAAYHFMGAGVVIVSSFREHAGRHGTGEALDIRLRGVRAATLAAFLRGMPRAGVGVYTHRRTQFVHVDVREQSFHWLDASPPGVHWREAQLRDPHAAARDASWRPEMDLPGAAPPGSR
jgi:hypothetical protein